MLEVREELVAALKKYRNIILKEKQPSSKMSESSNQDTLLHFDVVDAKPFVVADSDEPPDTNKSSVDVLSEIFATTSIPDSGDVLQPLTVLKHGLCAKIILSW